eukprot:1175835-Prorocentrum_minimum.AAC.1
MQFPLNWVRLCGCSCARCGEDAHSTLKTRISVIVPYVMCAALRVWCFLSAASAQASVNEPSAAPRRSLSPYVAATPPENSILPLMICGRPQDSRDGYRGPARATD